MAVCTTRNVTPHRTVMLTSAHSSREKVRNAIFSRAGRDWSGKSGAPGPGLSGGGGPVCILARSCFMEWYTQKNKRTTKNLNYIQLLELFCNAVGYIA